MSRESIPTEVINCLVIDDDPSARYIVRRLLSESAFRLVEASDGTEGFALALQIVRPRGTLVLKSTFAAHKPLNLAPVVIDEVTIVGSRCGPFKEAIKALAEKSVDVTSMIQKRMKIEQGVEAMELAGRAGVLKVLLTFE